MEVFREGGLQTPNTSTTSDGNCLEVVPNYSTIHIFCMVLLVICIVSTFGNLLTIIVVIINPLKNLHTPFIFFMVNLSIADLLQGFLTLPLVIYKLHEHEKGIRLTSRAVQLLTCISLLSVFFSTIIISLDRHVAITEPIKYRIQLSSERCVKISVVIWVISVGSGLLVTFNPKPLIAFLAYNYFMFVVGIIVMIFVFVRNYLYLKKYENEYKLKLEEKKTSIQRLANSRYNREKRVTVVLLIVLSIFMATYIPALIMLNITQFCIQCSCHLRFSVYVIRYILLVSNSAFNPFVYTIRMKDFRNSLKALFQGKHSKQYSLLIDSTT